MASPPPKRLITSDDIPGAPGWFSKVLDPLNAFIKATAGALDRGLTFRQQFAGEVKTVPITPPDDWVPLTLAPGWTATANAAFKPPPAYHQRLDGEVVLRGLITPPGAPSSGATIASKLPDPYAQERHIIDALNTPGYVETKAGGLLTYAAGSGALYSLSGVRYFAADRTPPRWDKPVDVRLGSPDKPFPGKPAHVLVLGCRPVQTPTAPAPVTWLDWTATTVDKNVAAIRIHRAWGLSPGVAYSLTLGIFPE